MMREDIEKAMRHPTTETAEVAAQLVNAALEEARVEISEAKDVESAMSIVDRLKIK